MTLKRVVITGLGMVTPLGSGVNHNWQTLLSGQSGISTIDSFDVSDITAKIAGQIPTQGPGAFDESKVLTPKERRKVDKFIVYGLAAADEAIAHAGWAPQDHREQCRTGVMIGSGIGGLQTIYETSHLMDDRGPRRISPFFIPASLINLISGHVSIRYGYKGPNHSVVTACSTGAHAIGDAARLIALDDVDVMVAGGAEGAVTRLGMAGFAAARALSTGYNDRPTEASRPFDEARDGFVMGEGAGVVVLESLEHAKARGATIYGELVGYGLSGDAHHITSPSEDGDGAFRAMQAAVKRAGIAVSDIDYINAHGTSTPLGDAIEVKAVKRLLGDHAGAVSMSSTKSAIGHLLGAAGAVEFIYGAKAIETNTAPATLNLHAPSEGCDGIDLVPLTPRERQIDVVLSNSFGFGGTNASLILKRFQG